jgi:hypothetical protein
VPSGVHRMFHNSSGHLRHIVALELSATASFILNKFNLINIVSELCSNSVNRFLLKADSHIACRAHAVPLPCREAKGLECVFPI